LCALCGYGHSIVERTIAVSEFDDLGREAVHTLKYHGRFAIAGMMGRLMASAAREEVDCQLVTHVPLHPSRRRERGYDQSSKLAASAAQALKLAHRSNLLRRTRKTRQQVSLDREERISNVRGAFQATQSLNQESILLVDDVSTTGATLSAAASALRQAGAGPIIGLVFARALS
jgi:ComF family protein